RWTLIANECGSFITTRRSTTRISSSWESNIRPHVRSLSMAEAKTKPTNESVEDFLNRIADAERREDCFAVAKMMEEITGEKPKMWGPSIVGFGSYTYKYASGHGGDWPIAAFSPRKKDLTVYLMMGFEKHTELMDKL